MQSRSGKCRPGSYNCRPRVAKLPPSFTFGKSDVCDPIPTCAPMIDLVRDGRSACRSGRDLPLVFQDHGSSGSGGDGQPYAGLDIHNPVFVISGLSIILFVFFALALPEQAEACSVR